VLLVFEVCAGFHLAQIAEKSINTIEILIVCFEVTERLSRDNREGVFLSESRNDFFTNVTVKYSQNIFLLHWQPSVSVILKLINFLFPSFEFLYLT
jgi:hypothetical protein